MQVEAVRFLVASASTEIAKRALLALGTGGARDAPHVTRYEDLKAAAARHAPELILVDASLPGLCGVAALCASLPHLKFIVLADDISEAMELELFKAGVRGCCGIDAELAELAQAAQAVTNGEYWIRRRISARLLDHFLGQAPVIRPRQASFTLAALTAREREIADLVGRGHSNKEIARALVVTERTVKAHLTQVFRKLDVSGRVHLALHVTGESASARAPLPRQAVGRGASNVISLVQLRAQRGA